MIFKRILKGVLNGFPLVRNIIQAISGKDIGVPLTEAGNDAPEGTYKLDGIVIITEVMTVALIAAFIFGKINIEDLKAVLGLINSK